ncbi:MAG: hypothetical protein LIO90_01895 [Bacteroidales bacterium]|nr:hypothetical protein [Bacteroidales bacterium]
MTNLPPIEKVYEAWSAIADGRVAEEGPDKTRVTSSDGAKTYTVIYHPDTDTYQSNDNATAWRRYPGYPILAAMMVRERLPLDMAMAQQWAGVNWTQLNQQYKRDYAAAVDHVERERGIDHAEASRQAEAVMSLLESLPITVKRLNQPQV